MQRQLSYAIKRPFAGSLWHKGGFHAQKGPIFAGFHAGKESMIESKAWIYLPFFLQSILVGRDRMLAGIWCNWELLRAPLSSRLGRNPFMVATNSWLRRSPNLFMARWKVWTPSLNCRLCSSMAALFSSQIFLLKLSSSSVSSPSSVLASELVG